MSASTKVKLSTQIDPELLEQVREIAENEGRMLQALIDEALRNLVEERRQATPRRHVLAHYLASIESFGPLYQKLAE